jgi:hypothetical protein
MIHSKQSQGQSMAGIDWGRAFRAQLISSIPTPPVVVSRRIAKIRTPHWLSGFLTSPVTAVAPRIVDHADDRSAKNIADWSSYLPANCVDIMISLGWDRTT